MNANPDDLQMSFGEHLEELRTRVIYALIGVGVAACLTFAFGFQLVGLLARPYLEAQYALGMNPQLFALDYGAGFSTYMLVAGVAAVVLAGPWVIYQLWQFVAAGLYEAERRAVHALWPLCVLQTALGLAFGYFIMLPVSTVFFLNMTSMYPDVTIGRPGFMTRLVAPSPEVHPPPPGVGATPLFLPVLDADPDPLQEGMVWVNRTEGRIKTHFGGFTRVIPTQTTQMLAPFPAVDRYVTSVALIGLGVVVAFQLPVVLLMVGKTGLVPPAFFRQYRKHTIFGLLALAAVLTPADVLSMVLLFIPLYALFELGLVLMRRAYRPAAGPDAEA